MADAPLIVLGIDALDWGYVSQRRSGLPTLASWPTVTPLNSIFPPDSLPAWATIFTGVKPGDHGLLESIDFLDPSPSGPAHTAADRLRGRTFWDHASEMGLRVGVINPFLAYPAWDVNGLMVSGPVFVDGTVSVTGIAPEDLPPFPQLGGIVTFPTKREIGSFVEETLRDTRAQAQFGLEVLTASSPDLFFLNLLTVDRIKHFLWCYVDPEDPTYPGPNPHQDAIDRMYDLIDEILAAFAEHGEVIALSDHGHARRCTRMVYLDEIFRREGYIDPPASSSARMKSYLLERAKAITLETVYRLGIEEHAYRAARHLPNRKAIKYSSFSPNAGTIAKTSRAFGRNAHGGVDLPTDTPERRRQVIDFLESVRDPENDAGPVFEWVCEREQVVSGSNIERYPPVLFKLRADYGVDFGMYGRAFGPDVNHRRISGGHRPVGVFACSAPTAAPASIEDFYGYLMGRLEAHARPAGQ